MITLISKNFRADIGGYLFRSKSLQPSQVMSGLSQLAVLRGRNNSNPWLCQVLYLRIQTKAEYH